MHWGTPHTVSATDNNKYTLGFAEILALSSHSFAEYEGNVCRSKNRNLLTLSACDLSRLRGPRQTRIWSAGVAFRPPPGVRIHPHLSRPISGDQLSFQTIWIKSSAEGQRIESPGNQCNRCSSVVWFCFSDVVNP